MANSGGFANERRRCTHHLIVMNATLKLNSFTRLPCKLRDFCLGGMFLTIQDPESRKAALVERLQQSVEIEIYADHQAKVHTLLARVAHVAESGIGVAFEEVSIATLKALFWQASMGAQHHYTAIGPEALGDINYESVKENFARTVHQFLHRTLEDFFPRAEQALFDISGQVEASPEQVVILDAAAELRLNKSQVEVDFSRKLLQSLQFFLVPEESQSNHLNSDATLALSGSQNFTDWAQFAEIIVASESEYQDTLASLAQKITNLTCFIVDPRHNPLTPAAICEVFRTSLGPVKLVPKAKHTVLSAFGHTLHQHLSALYQELGVLLEPLPAVRFYQPGKPEHSLDEHSFGILGQRPADQLKQIEQGLPVTYLDKLSKNLGMRKRVLANQLSIPPGALKARYQTGRFERDESERLHRLLRLHDQAQTLLGESQALKTWLLAEKCALSGHSPLDYADLEPGAQEVEDFLGRLAYGICS